MIERAINIEPRQELQNSSNAEIVVKRRLSPQAAQQGAGGFVADFEEVATVPITRNSRRKFHLMTEDSATLAFTLKTPVDFKVGDYFDDVLFGTFVLRERQMPTFNKQTGGWDYNIRFDKEYWLWQNHIFMLAAPNDNGTSYISTTTATDELDAGETMIVVEPSSASAQGKYSRREAKWTLTAPLAEHAAQIVANLLSVDIQLFGRRCKVRIHSTASKRSEVRFLSYDGQGICAALTAIANEYETEWWVTYETVSQVNYVVIHFGKCQYPGEPLVFKPGGNVESINISRDLSSYANRLFVFGGTNNIPDSYRKKLYFDIDSIGEVYESGVQPWNVFWAGSWLNVSPKFNPYTMLLDKGTEYDPKKYEFGATSGTYLNYKKETATMDAQDIDVEVTFKGVYATVHFYVNTSSSQGYMAGATYTSVLTLELWEETDNGIVKLGVIGSNEITTPWYSTVSNGRTILRQGVTLPDGTFTIPAGKECFLRLTMATTVSLSQGTCSTEELSKTAGGDILYPLGRTFKAAFIWNSNSYAIMFNPRKFLDGGGRTCEFVFIDSQGERTSPPQGFNVDNGNSQHVQMLQYASTMIPMSWYTDDTDNPSSVIGFGERRLRLPSIDPDDPSKSYDDGYVETSNCNEEERVERTLVADSIYPKCYLRVRSVEADPYRKERMELSDGTVYEWKWTAYKLKLEKLDEDPAAAYNDDSFPFEQTYIKEGEKLQAVFLSDMDTQKAYEEMQIDTYTSGNYLLAGMTFDVSFVHEGNSRIYTLIRNEDYGAKLPNDTLKPTVGDVLVLTGWDVKAMEDLELLEDAENRLLAFGKEYLDALEEDGWTFRCEMMSEWPWFLYGGYDWDETQLIEGDDKFLIEHFDKQLLSRVGRSGWGTVDGQPNTTKYTLPPEGTRVTVEYEALSGGSKTSRVIGYELKLDVPYDTPVYEIGETDAYSRIKQMERKLQNIK